MAIQYSFANAWNDNTITKCMKIYTVGIFISIVLTFVISSFFIIPFTAFFILLGCEVKRVEAGKKEEAEQEIKLADVISQEIAADLIRSSGSNIPLVRCDVQLEPKEQCFYQGFAGLIELRPLNAGYVRNSVTFRLRMGHGLYLNSTVGAASGETMYEWKTVDNGIMYITSARTIFRGHRKSVSIKHKTALHFDFSEHGFLRIDKASGAPLVLNDCPTIVLEAVYERILSSAGSL